MPNRITLTCLAFVGGALLTGLAAGNFASRSPAALTAHVASPFAEQLAVISSDDVKPGNPEVEPGKVHWHPSIDAAMTAAKVSKKPVLVLHMMGRLDRQFC